MFVPFFLSLSLCFLGWGVGGFWGGGVCCVGISLLYLGREGGGVAGALGV